VIRISTAINDDNSYLHTSDSENILALFHFSRIGMLLFTVATAQHNTADIPPRFKMLEAFVPSWATRTSMQNFTVLRLLEYGGIRV